MKRLKTWGLIAFFTLATLYAVFQSDFAKSYLKKILVNALKESNLDLHIDKIEGTLPHQINLIGVKIKIKEVDLTFDSIKMRPILWRLLNDEFAFKAVHAKGEQLNFDGSFKISKKKALIEGIANQWNVYTLVQIQQQTAYFRAKNKELHFKGKALFAPNWDLVSANIQLGTDQLLAKLPFAPQGNLTANLTITHVNNTYLGNIHWKIPTLTVEKKRLKNMKGKGNLKWERGKLTGQIDAGTLASALLDLEIDSNLQLRGQTSLHIANLQSLHIPNIYGKIEAKALFDIDTQGQTMHLDVIGNDLYTQELYAQKASLYSDLSASSFLVDVEIENGKWKEMGLEHLSFETSSQEKMHPFRLFAEGKWKHPIELHMNGTWENHFLAHIDSLTGNLYKHPFALQAPVDVEMRDDRFLVPEVKLQIGDATASLNVKKINDQISGDLALTNLPLDLLSLNPLDVPINGTLNLTGHIQEKKKILRGDFEASITDLHVETINLNGNGSFIGNFNRDLLNIEGHLSTNEQKLVDLNLNIPIEFSLLPPHAKLLTHKHAKGQISFNGNIENFLDFVDLGPHRLTGICEGHITFTNTLYRPQLTGSFSLDNGFYENYFTGTTLKNIHAKLLADKNIVTLTSLSAHDAQATGTLSATGKIELLEADNFPYTLDAIIHNLNFLNIDLISAATNGSLHIEGNSLSAIATGDIQIFDTLLTIPDHIRRPIPNIQVTYRNSIHPVAPPEMSYEPYPLALDLQVKTPQTIAINGKGLSSEWKGDFHLGGTYTSLAARGKLELISGEFNFSSRSFKLSDGTISLSGHESEMPYINLAGTMETKGITITARLKGPLDNPQITLTSSPPLPLGSIMSYLLFGQDVSDIGGFQALELATSLASLAGTGPDVMENTRKALGVDRLRIITDPTQEGGETISIQVGKYVTDDVLISFTQGTEESSSNISVEVELKNNFVFQIESDQQHEQGKFTLKWNLNY